MTDDRLHELLSAYLDGEVTDAERAEVEAWLERDGDARLELEELATISSAVRMPPAGRESPDLRDAVLGEITRPTSTTVVPRDRLIIARADSSVPRSSGAAGIVALVATLVCTLLIAVVLGPGRDSDSGAHSGPAFANRQAVDGALAKAEPVRGGETEERRDELDLAATVNPADPMPVAKDVLGPDRLYVIKEADLTGAKGYVEPVEASVDNLEAGDVVPFIERSSDRVAVVEVTVVDVERAFGEVQLLLQRNAIREVDAKEISKNASNERGRLYAELERQVVNEEKRAGGEAFAVYVSTSPARLNAALEDLRRSELVVSLASPPSPTIASAARMSVPDRGAAPEAPTLPEVSPVLDGNAARARDEEMRKRMLAGRPGGDFARRFQAEPAAGAVPGPNSKPDVSDDYPGDAAGERGAGNGGVELAQQEGLSDSYQVLRRYRSSADKQKLAELQERITATAGEGESGERREGGRDPKQQSSDEDRAEYGDGPVRVLIVLQRAGAAPRDR